MQALARFVQNYLARARADSVRFGPRRSLNLPNNAALARRSNQTVPISTIGVFSFRDAALAFEAKCECLHVSRSSGRFELYLRNAIGIHMHNSGVQRILVVGIDCPELVVLPRSGGGEITYANYPLWRIGSLYSTFLCGKHCFHRARNSTKCSR